MSVCPMPSCRKPKPRKRTRSRSRPRKQKKIRCYKAGKVTRNAFFNFLREYRKQACGKTIIQIAIDGAKIWNGMSEEERCKYMQQAYCAPKSRRGRRGRSRRR